MSKKYISNAGKFLETSRRPINESSLGFSFLKKTFNIIQQIFE